MADKKKDTEFRVVDSLQYSDAPDKNYVPEGFDDVEDFLQNMREEYDLDLEFDRLNREEAISDKKFAAGEQWDPVVLEHRKGLPNLVINSVPQFTAQLVGDWRQNRNSIKVLPSEDGDVDVARIREDLVRSIQIKSRADRVYDSAFESAVQSGDGAFRVSIEYARDDVFDQDLFIRPIDDAMSVVWDRLSVDPTGRDARHVFVDDLISKKEFKAKFGEKAPSTLSSDNFIEATKDGWVTEAGVRVTEYWRMIERDRLLCLFESGKIIALQDDTDFQKLVEQYGTPVKTRIAPCLYAQMHLVTGFDLLAGPFEYKINRVPIIRMIGRVVNVAGKRVRYGLVRFMKDPVRLRNFWRSVAAEQLGYAPKAQWIAPESAVEGREDMFRKAHLSRDPLLIYNDDATNPPERVNPPAVEAALLNEAAVNTQDMKDVTGIHDASLGVKSNETSGKAILARQREGDVANITYHDNGNAALLEAGDVINQLIPKIYDGTRTIRVIGEDEAPRMIRINDPMDPTAVDLSVGSYDVALTTGVSYTTRRVEAAEAMMQAIQVAPELMQVAGDLIVKAQDWPGADKLAERLKKTIPPQLLSEEEGGTGQPSVDPQQLAMMQQQMQEMAQKMPELEHQYKIKEGELNLKAEELKLKWYDAETKRISALSDNMVDANQIEMDALGKILDHHAGEQDRQVSRETAVMQKDTADKAAKAQADKAKASSSKGSTTPKVKDAK